MRIPLGVPMMCSSVSSDFKPDSKSPRGPRFVGQCRRRVVPEEHVLADHACDLACILDPIELEVGTLPIWLAPGPVNDPDRMPHHPWADNVLSGDVECGLLLEDTPDGLVLVPATFDCRLSGSLRCR